MARRIAITLGVVVSLLSLTLAVVGISSGFARPDGEPFAQRELFAAPIAFVPALLAALFSLGHALRLQMLAWIGTVPLFAFSIWLIFSWGMLYLPAAILFGVLNAAAFRAANRR